MVDIKAKELVMSPAQSPLFLNEKGYPLSMVRSSMFCIKTHKSLRA
jgi:hypothetical protein